MRFSSKVFLTSFICLNLLVGFCSTLEAQAFEPFGIVAENGCAIQPFFEERVSIGLMSKDVAIRLPQDETILAYDKFFIYMDIRDTEIHNVSISLYRYGYKTIRTWDEQSGSYIYENKSGYHILASTHFMQLFAGKNDRHDTRYSIGVIDSTEWSIFIETDIMELVVIEYLDVRIEFFHLTNPALVPITQTRGTLQMLFIMYIILQVVFFIAGALFFSYLYKKNSGAYVKFDMWSVLLILTWGVIGYLIWALAQGMGQNEFLRQTVMIPLELIELILAFLLSVWIPSLFRKEPEDMFIFKWNFPDNLFKIMNEFLTKDEDKVMSQLISGDVKVLEAIKTRDGYKYFEDSDSLMEMIGTFFWGSIKVVNYDQTFKVKAEGKQILLVEDYKYSDPDFQNPPIFMSLNYVTLYWFVGEIILYVLFEYLKMTQAFFWVGLAFFSAFVVYYLREKTRTKKTLYLEPVTRSSLMVAYDGATVNKLEMSYIDLANTYSTLKKDYSIQRAKSETRAGIRESLIILKFLLFLQKRFYGNEFVERNTEIKDWWDKDSFMNKLESDEVTISNSLKDEIELEEDEHVPEFIKEKLRKIRHKKEKKQQKAKDNNEEKE